MDGERSETVATTVTVKKPVQVASKATRLTIPDDLCLEMHRRMVTIRRFEEAVWEVYTQGLMRGLAHLYIGEEATAVGVCAALRTDDYITSTHRGHGHLIAKGGRVDRMMAEMLGKVDGYNRGKGGTMHIADLSLGILGANGIVGGGMGLATGAALSAKMRGTDQVAVCFFGDGAANQGVFLEAANLAAVWKLPVLFVCENNQYGEYTAAKHVTAIHEHIAERAAAFDIPGLVVDGNDVVAVYEATKEMVDRARAGEGPSLIECKTYRYRGHHVGDGNPEKTYRTQEETDAWKAKDPIARFQRRLIEAGLATEADLAAWDGEIQQQIQEAVEFAKQSPYPPASEVTDHVYV
ncbi:MAG: thiamine pyrophosphate-dependent dehydrogenase E1 component subunit alpha [Candidatus Latescibacteria bacterium]|nr:thiamine pyrophosphate-dependent dehydrogenase E1 component subunit alpha [Candidatus Latescibacterota bacterium]